MKGWTLTLQCVQETGVVQPFGEAGFVTSNPVGQSARSS